MTTRLIIDTDIGDDVDDLLAIAFAERLSEIELVGITTVFRNTVLRAKMARYFLRNFSRYPDLPVHAGIGKPFVKDADVNAIPNQYKAEMDDCEPDSTDAVGFLRDTLLAEPATIVCIGPLTNLGRLLQEHPEVKPNIERVVIMGGVYFTPSKEWNILCDPEAADIVFTSGVQLTCVGLDVTLRCRLSKTQMDAIDAADSRNAFILEACHAWEGVSATLPILHDPLTVFTLLSDSDMQYKDEEVSIELEGKHTRGMTYCRPHRLFGREPETPNAQVAANLDEAHFVSYFLERTFNA